VPQVPGVTGVTVIWPALQAQEFAASFRKPGGASRWHTDLVHERQPAGITHLHNDTVPPVGGDTLWASGYAAYEKLSPDFRKIIDGKYAVYRSAHPYLDKDNPTAGPKYIERTHPLVRVHPATGWKALWVNRAMTDRIVGLDKAESDVILGYLYDVYEKNVDIQVRFRWTPGTSALWDNRITVCSPPPLPCLFPVSLSVRMCVRARLYIFFPQPHLEAFVCVYVCRCSH
jgi:alpha-ketoglutarate-dependent taurine dioxygenase